MSRTCQEMSVLSVFEPTQHKTTFPTKPGGMLLGMVVPRYDGIHDANGEAGFVWALGTIAVVETASSSALGSGEGILDFQRPCEKRQCQWSSGFDERRLRFHLQWR
mmetsp:Transcript_15194/g.31851  ORF Transcript_15194/g.31851 Transcript_15194/m.31851 type:complete len:106 (-) Transcript_15194:146-463(-)